MSKKKQDKSPFGLGTIEKMLNATPSQKSEVKEESPVKETKVPKKRGRKKASDVTNVTNVTEAPEAPEASDKPKPTAKKRKTKKKSEESLSSQQIPTKDTGTPTVYDIDSNDNANDNTNNSNNQSNDNQAIILQLPLTEEEISKYSSQNPEDDERFLVNELLEYNPHISPFNPKPLIQTDKGEEMLSYTSKDSRSIFRPCIRCAITPEGTVVPCIDCTKQFNLDNELISIDDALLKRAEDDALYCRPDPTNFQNTIITEKKIPTNFVVDKYNPNVIVEFSNEPSAFKQGNIQYVEEVNESPYQNSRAPRFQDHENVKDVKESEMLMSTAINSAPIEDITTTTQFRILNEFTQLEKWPKRTNVYCWWDCHPFDTTPVGIPISYNKKFDYFTVYGCFCSFECAMAYKKSDIKMSKISNDLFYDLRKRYGETAIRLSKDQKQLISDIKQKQALSSIHPAMPRKSLSIFGGKLSIQEFRKYSCATNLSTKVYQFPFIPANEIIEIVPKKYNNLELSKCNSPPLKLKRTKPLPGSKNTLEHTLNISKSKNK